MDCLVNALRIEGASFSWGNEEKVLKNINLRIPRGSIAAVVGPVGSGKSSLISSILGETEKFSGTVNTDGTMAYVAQQAWIQNATLRVSVKLLSTVNQIMYMFCFRIISCLADRSTINFMRRSSKLAL